MRLRAYHGFIEIGSSPLLHELLYNYLGPKAWDHADVQPGRLVLQKYVSTPADAITWDNTIVRTMWKQGFWNWPPFRDGADFWGLEVEVSPGEWEEWEHPDTGESIAELEEAGGVKRWAPPSEMSALPDVPLPPDIPRPEMWTVESIVQAVRDGFTFLIPFVWGKHFGDPNAYYIAGHQYSATGLTVGPEHTPDILVGEDGWLRVKTFFRPEMVPKRAWLGPPNEFGVVAVYLEIDPETIDWELLNRGHQIQGRVL